MAIDGKEEDAEKTNKDEVTLNRETEDKITEKDDEKQNNVNDDEVTGNNGGESDDEKEMKLVSNESDDEKNENKIPDDPKEKNLISNEKKIEDEVVLPVANAQDNKKDERSSPSDLPEPEKIALMDLRSKIEDTFSSTENDISLWGVPLLPNKNDIRTDTILLKFLRARDFKPSDAFEMLQNTLTWRKENRMDSIIDEDLGIELDYGSVTFTKGLDREGHPICYNVYGAFADEEMYEKTFGNEASRDKFLRWRMQLLEKQIRELDFGPGGISTFLQVNDLKNTPGPSRRDLRLATRKAVDIFQDNYPEFVSGNIFVNVPFWYYAFNTLLSPFLTQRTKSKFVFSRPSRVTDTLIKSIGAEEIPVGYGGLRRENDPDFSIQDTALETIVKAGATETVEIPALEVGTTLTWDLTITGWDVNYKEEFVPTDEASYTLIVKKGRKISWEQEPIRNSFKNKEPGKVVITIENGIFRKKRVLYRYKAEHQPVSSST